VTTSGEERDDARAPIEPRGRRGRASLRRLAIEATSNAAETGVFIDEAIAPHLETLEPRDRHLLQEITYGAVRHRSTLDAIIEHHVKFPVARQKPLVAAALRTGAYQLVYLQRVPQHAAVDQTVEGLKSSRGADGGAPGFVNAVLHKVASMVRRKSSEPPLERDDPTVLPIRGGFCHLDRPILPLIRLDLCAHLALKHSEPGWLVERWLERFGEEETRLLCEAQNRVPPLTARVTARAPSRDALMVALAADGLSAVPGALEDSIVLRSGGDLAKSRAIVDGWMQIQDETSIRIGAALAPPPGARALDLCAAPGGKALQLLEAVGPSGELVAADRGESRLALLRQTLERGGSNFTTAIVPENPDQVDFGGRFSHVLIDAPCSNTGVLARRPEARWRLQRADLDALAALQSRLLEAALRHVAPGGRLVYSTCSIEPEENENIVARAFERHPGLVELDTQLFLPHRRKSADGGYFSLILTPRPS